MKRNENFPLLTHDRIEKKKQNRNFFFFAAAVKSKQALRTPKCLLEVIELTEIFADKGGDRQAKSENF